METDKNTSIDFKAAANEVFGTLLTITTILSGVYVSITFGWFGTAMITPHPGEPMTYEMLAFAVVGIFLGLAFILPLVFILLAWAFAKFRNSAAWGTAAWAGLIYCLVQDFIGIVAMFSFSLIATGAIIGLTLTVAGAFVVLIPPICGMLIGHRVGVRYCHLDPQGQARWRHPAIPAVMMVVAILAVQAALVTVLFMGGALFGG
jgi:hypothetical protein